MTLRKHFDALSLLVIMITFGAFVAALFTTGLAHDILVEAGVFLISVKLIQMMYKISVANSSLLHTLGEIQSAVQRLERASSNRAASKCRGKG